MKKLILLITIPILLFIQCKQSPPEESIGTPIKAPKVSPILSKDTIVIADDLLNQWEVNLRDYALDKNNKFRVQKEPFPNRHDPKQVDTIVVLNSNSEQFVFYKSKVSMMLQSAKITNPKLKLAGQLSLGKSKSELTFLEQGKAVDQIIVQDEMDLMHYTFTFDENQKLNQLKYVGYVD